MFGLSRQFETASSWWRDRKVRPHPRAWEGQSDPVKRQSGYRTWKVPGNNRHIMRRNSNPLTRNPKGSTPCPWAVASVAHRLAMARAPWAVAKAQSKSSTQGPWAVARAPHTTVKTGTPYTGEYTEQGSSYQGTGFAHGLPTSASTLSGQKASQQAGTLSSGQVNSYPTNLEAMVKDTIGRPLLSIISEAVRATRAQASDPAPTGYRSPIGDLAPVGGLALDGDLVPAGNLAPQPSTASVQQASLQATNQLTGEPSAQASKVNSPAPPLDLQLTKEIKAKNCRQHLCWV